MRDGTPFPKTRRGVFPALPPRIENGTRLGPYQVDDEISRGSEASVFLAHERNSGRQVAVKVLSPDLALHDECVERFHQEVRLASRVRHQLLLPVISEGCQDGFYFYATPFADGGTLQNKIYDYEERRRKKYFVELARRFSELAWALHTLHESGLVHRDVKPSNILLTQDDQWYLADFGSALERNDELAGFSHTGGTVYFMSPEQLVGKTDPLDPRGDIYALGVTLYEIATGEEPFPRLEDSKLARWKITRHPKRPRDANHLLPLRLEAIIRRAMEPNPTLRYASAAEMASDLERFVERRCR